MVYKQKAEYFGLVSNQGTAKHHDSNKHKVFSLC
jgi:hypothetical protein